jgi:HSF-type DNA-binding
MFLASHYNTNKFAREQRVDDRSVANLVGTIDAFLKDVQSFREQDTIKNYCLYMENNFSDHAKWNGNIVHDDNVNNSSSKVYNSDSGNSFSSNRSVIANEANYHTEQQNQFQIFSEASSINNDGSQLETERCIVNHDYHDYNFPGSIEKLLTRREIKKLERRRQKLHKALSKSSHESDRIQPKTRVPFPQALYQLLQDTAADGYGDVISWEPHGRSFRVLDSKRFVADVLPKYFKQTKIQSFLRQISLYGFLRITRKGNDCGSYYHERFLRGHALLACTIQRTAVKGTGLPYIPSPDTEPDFDAMPPAGVDSFDESL